MTELPQEWTKDRGVYRQTYTADFREIPLPINSGLITALLKPGQFSAFSLSLPFFYNQDRQQIPCFIHSSKIVNYYNAVAEDILFI
jgi:hypothetical protein